ncbi:MAG TPA: CAP domain-containing protein [Rubricoccaceae bacterium]|nr:CAP domain-containing protein [Rubricoccaceae bacterium]
MPSPRVFVLPLILSLLAGCDVAGALLASDDRVTDDPADAWSEMLTAVNAARAEGRACGSTWYEAAPPLAWNGRLARAARVHVEDMAAHDFFSHTGSDGSRVDDRVERQGYDWRRLGENIARNQFTVEEVVSQWIESPGHCANLMHPSFTELGAAEVDRHWGQVFGRPR